MATQSSAPEVDVDGLAREKVQEVEEILDKTDELKLASIKSCFSILKQIITAADLHRTNAKDKSDSDEQHSKTNQNSESIYADYADDHEQFNAVDLSEQFATNSVKWTIRVRAFKAVHRIFDLLMSPSSTRQAANKSTVLKLLPDLVRLSFVAATSPYDDLKIQGFQMFRELINRFASVEEREFPGHSILEQYKTQVLSALKPAFNLDAPPYITAIACQVTTQWICRGLEKESSGLKRAFQLIEPSIEKLESQSINPNSLLYQEIELEQERLDILGSWAQLYITSHESAGQRSKLLAHLMIDRVDSLVGKWWEALKDYALLIMLSPKTITNSHDNEHVYTRDVASKLFTPIWPKLTLAVTTWLCTPSVNNKSVKKDENESPLSQHKSNADTRRKYFRFLCGILINEFCKSLHLDPSTDSLPESTTLALRSLNMLLTSDVTNKSFFEDLAVAREFYTALGKALTSLNNLKNSHIILLQGAILQIFEMILIEFKDTDKIVQYSLTKLLVSIENGIGSSGHTSHRLMFTNLIVLSKARPDLLLDEDCKLLSAFIDVVIKILDEKSTNSSVITSTIDSVHSLQRDLPESSAATVAKRLFKPKLALLEKSITAHSTADLTPTQKPESRILFDTMTKSMKLDLEFLAGDSERPTMLSSMIKTLLAKFDMPKDHVNQMLRDLERRFTEDFDELRKSNHMKGMIDGVLKPAAKEAEKPDKRNKRSGALKKPSSTIVLKSDFSNFYSKK